MRVVSGVLIGSLVSLVARVEAQTIKWRDQSPHQSDFVEIDGAKIHYLDWGGRGPLIIMLHGWGSNAHTFDDLAPRLSDRFRVVGMTFRGFGESDKSDSVYSMKRYADDVDALRRHLRADRVILVGHSFGGWVISRLATTTSSADRLVFLDAAFDMPRSDSIIGLRPFQRPGAVRTEAEYYPWLRQYFYGMWSSALEADARVNAQTRPARGVNVALDEARNAPEVWAKLTVPSLAICALAEVRTEFPWITPDSSSYSRARLYVVESRRPFQSAECRRFAAIAPRSRILELDGGHFIHAWRQDDVARAIREFLLDE